MIDLRSDTLTVPTPGMREAISVAEVGDDVFGEDRTVNLLQDKVADMLGKEAAIYVPSGTMSNQIAIACHTNAGDEVIAEADAHIFYYETAAPAVISRVQINCIPSKRGAMDPTEVKRRIRHDVYYLPKTSLICIENTHNRHGGAIIPLENIQSICSIAKEAGIRTHCDGARIWNASVATGISPREYASYFDSVSVCLSKGLGAPVGSVLVGEKILIDKARKWRKILGGGMRQAGIIAAAGLYALENHYTKLSATHENARLFAAILNESQYIEINMEGVETNMAMFRIPDSIDEFEFESRCREAGVLIIPFGYQMIRAVFHFQIERHEIIKAAEIIIDVVKKLTK
jgi:threonine aldolase